VLTVATGAEVVFCLVFLLSAFEYRQSRAQYPAFLQTLHTPGWVFEIAAGLYNFLDSSDDYYLTISTILLILTISSSRAA